MPKLMVLDGHSIANRAFYGVRSLNAPDGTPTNAVFGFINILERLIKAQSPDGVAVVFDVHAPTFRHQRCDYYKATRHPMPEELHVQIPLIQETLEAMGIRHYELPGYEADDLMGAFGRICRDNGWDCRLVTGDRDNLQLIDDTVHVLYVKNSDTVEYGAEEFRAEYGFEPKRLIDLKALMGDSSDNIHGVAGIGQKTAMDLVQRFGTIDDIYSDLDGLDVKDGVRKKLAAGEDAARESYWLATIDVNAPLEASLTDTLWRRGDSWDKPRLASLLRRLGFVRFLDLWRLRDVQEPETAAGPAAEFTGECVSRVIADENGLGEALSAMTGTQNVAVSDDLAFVVFENDGTAYVIAREGYSGDYGAALGRLFGPGVKKAGHNIKNIIRSLLDLNVRCGGWEFDTALAGYLLDSTAGSYDVPRLCQKYCGFMPPEISADLPGQARTVGRLTTEAAAVACLRDAMAPKLTELGMDDLYYNTELPLCRVLASMEKAGFLVNRDALKRFGEALGTSIEALQERIWFQAGQEFNINSPKQLGEILFEKMMLPAGKKTKTGWSTSADVLENLRGRDPIIQDILDFRELTKLKSTYADGLLKVIDEDGRIRTSFQMTVTATGRLSSTEPNLQNIPVRRDLGGEIRKMFTAGPGNVLVDADYSQIELRLLSHISGDEAMRRAFIDGEDIHAVTASQVFDVPLSSVTGAMRSRAKAVNFGIVYGISAFSLARDIDVSNKEAQAYIDTYFRKYSGVKNYMEKVIADARETGYVSSVYGRRRYLPELKSSNFNTRSFGERVARNMPIQGTAADIMKIAMVRCFDALEKEAPEAVLLLQVHDELIVECPEEKAEQVAAILTREMEGAARLSVPLTANAKWGKSWYDAK